MSDQLDEAARQAMETALASMRTLAREAGLHETTLARWRAELSGVSADSALALARALRERALRTLDAAARLEQVARQEKGDAP